MCDRNRGCRCPPVMITRTNYNKPVTKHDNLNTNDKTEKMEGSSEEDNQTYKEKEKV